MIVLVDRFDKIVKDGIQFCRFLAADVMIL